MSHVISIRNLTKRFGSKLAVDNLTLIVPAGSIFALLGDNGAGKSTTIKVLTGQHPPDAGQAEILGADCWGHAIGLRRKVGYVPERPRYYDWMSVSDIGWFVSGFHANGYLHRYRELAAGFRLDPTTKLKNLSKGGYAKVGLALALAIDPQVLILDEPTSGLDLLTRREFLNSMVDLAGVGRTILISSHQISEMERIASHVAIMADGRLLLSQPLDELKRRFLRVTIRFDGVAPEVGALGTVLEKSCSGRVLQVLVRDPVGDALDQFRGSANIDDIQETPMSLEEIYAAIMARPGGTVRPSEFAERQPVSAGQEG